MLKKQLLFLLFCSMPTAKPSVFKKITKYSISILPKIGIITKSLSALSYLYYGLGIRFNKDNGKLYRFNTQFNVPNNSYDTHLNNIIMMPNKNSNYITLAVNAKLTLLTMANKEIVHAIIYYYLSKIIDSYLFATIEEQKEETERELINA